MAKDQAESAALAVVSLAPVCACAPAAVGIATHCMPLCLAALVLVGVCYLAAGLTAAALGLLAAWGHLRPHLGRPGRLRASRTALTPIHAPGHPGYLPVTARTAAAISLTVPGETPNR